MQKKSKIPKSPKQKKIPKEVLSMIPQGVEVITKKIEKYVRREFEDSTVFVWKTVSPICNRMNHELKINPVEKYYSTVGKIFSETPFWRGKLFTNGVLRHEFLHWSLYPKDVFTAVKDTFEARDLLLAELGLSTKQKDWGKKFPYTLPEIQTYQNMIGDYLIHIHMSRLYEDEWKILWQFLLLGGNQEKRDSTFKVYIKAYNFLLPEKSTPIKLSDTTAELDAQKVAEIITKVWRGEVGKPWAIKEIAKILHKYYEQDKQECQNQQGEEGCSQCPKCGANDWEVIEVTERDANGMPTKIKIRCRKCGNEIEAKVNPYASPLKPSDKVHGAKVKWSTEDIDKILENSRGASRQDLGEIGIDLTEEEFIEAKRRAKLRKFIRENVVVSKTKLAKEGELFRVSSDVWRIGDSLLDVNIPQSELASMGIDDLRMIPELTLKKNVYVTVKGQDIEKLRGVKYIAFLDVSGSMSGKPERIALAMLREAWENCKKLGFEFYLALFSSRGARIPQDEIKRFFEDSSYRQSQSNLGGGTNISEGLKLFSPEEYKDANVLIISDCDIADTQEAREELLKIAQQTNSFKIVLIREAYRISDEEIQAIQQWFPVEKIRVLGIGTDNPEFEYERI